MSDCCTVCGSTDPHVTIGWPVCPNDDFHEENQPIPATRRIDLWERFLTWREGRRTRELCRAYVGTWSGRVRVCDKLRGHLDSHTYEFEDNLPKPLGR